MSVTLASIARFLCGLVDSVIYIVISKMYELFKDVAGIILYSQSMFDTLGQRIGLILGIFMLFRLAVALITYLISPDKLTDNSKGGAKMLTNIIFSLTLLVTVNMIFIQAYKVQKTVIDSNFIEKIFFGKKAQLPNINIGYTLYSSFLTPNIEGCETLLDPYTKIDPTCEQELNKITNTNINESLNNLLKNYELNKVFSNYDLLNYRINNDWLFSYLPILSTVAGGAVVLVLISFCMELATRAVKLLFLQLIAPVPIIANMDPAKGSEIFKKWYKECINTYLSIFIRVIGINFAIFMITLIKTEFANIFTGRSILLTALLVIGCLMFAKRVPKLLEDMLGIKFDGMSLKPLKKFQEQALGGKAISETTKKVIGATNGIAVGTLAGTAGLMTGQGIHRTNLSKAIAGGWKGEKLGKNFISAYNAGKLRHKELQEMSADGIKRRDVFEANMRETFGLESKATRVQRLANQGKSIQTAFDSIKQQMTACDSDDTNVVIHNGQTYSRSAKTISKELDELKKTTVDKQSFREQATAAVKLNAAKTGGEVTEREIQAQMDALYDRAVTAQKQKIADTEKELEGRINAAVAGIHSGKFTTGVASADKVISEQTESMNKLKQKSNELGASLDENYKPITAEDYDVVNIMKQGKAVGAQASSGKMQDYADIGKYTKKVNK